MSLKQNVHSQPPGNYCHSVAIYFPAIPQLLSHFCHLMPCYPPVTVSVLLYIAPLSRSYCLSTAIYCPAIPQLLSQCSHLLPRYPPVTVSVLPFIAPLSPALFLYHYYVRLWPSVGLGVLWNCCYAMWQMYSLLKAFQ
jgi:hypothetical protein